MKNQFFSYLINAAVSLTAVFGASGSGKSTILGILKQILRCLRSNGFGTVGEMEIMVTDASDFPEDVVMLRAEWVSGDDLLAGWSDYFLETASNSKVASFKRKRAQFDLDEFVEKLTAEPVDTNILSGNGGLAQRFQILLNHEDRQELKNIIQFDDERILIIEDMIRSSLNENNELKVKSFRENLLQEAFIRGKIKETRFVISKAISREINDFQHELEDNFADCYKCEPNSAEFYLFISETDSDNPDRAKLISDLLSPNSALGHVLIKSRRLLLRTDKDFFCNMPAYLIRKSEDGKEEHIHLIRLLDTQGFGHQKNQIDGEIIQDPIQADVEYMKDILHNYSVSNVVVLAKAGTEAIDKTTYKVLCEVFDGRKANVKLCLVLSHTDSYFEQQRKEILISGKIPKEASKEEKEQILKLEMQQCVSKHRAHTQEIVTTLVRAGLDRNSIAVVYASFPISADVAEMLPSEMTISTEEALRKIFEIVANSYRNESNRIKISTENFENSSVTVLSSDYTQKLTVFLPDYTINLPLSKESSLLPKLRESLACEKHYHWKTAEAVFDRWLNFATDFDGSKATGQQYDPPEKDIIQNLRNLLENLLSNTTFPISVDWKQHLAYGEDRDIDAEWKAFAKKHIPRYWVRLIGYQGRSDAWKSAPWCTYSDNLNETSKWVLRHLQKASTRNNEFILGNDVDDILMDKLKMATAYALNDFIKSQCTLVL